MLSVLKNVYGQLVQEKVELGIYHIDKSDFLILYQQACTITFIEKNIKSVFQAVRLVPYDPEKVLS